MERIVVRGTWDDTKVYADYYEVDGTRRSRLLPGARTKGDGRRKLAEIEARVAAGKPGIEVNGTPPKADPGDRLELRGSPGNRLAFLWTTDGWQGSTKVEEMS